MKQPGMSQSDYGRLVKNLNRELNLHKNKQLLTCELYVNIPNHPETHYANTWLERSTSWADKYDTRLPDASWDK